MMASIVDRFHALRETGDTRDFLVTLVLKGLIPLLKNGGDSGWDFLVLLKGLLNQW